MVIYKRAVLNIAFVGIVAGLILTPFRSLNGVSTPLLRAAFAGLGISVLFNLFRRVRVGKSLVVIVAAWGAAVAVAIPAEQRPPGLLYAVAVVIAVALWLGREALG
jgi:hypothetical protein